MRRSIYFSQYIILSSVIDIGIILTFYTDFDNLLKLNNMTIMINFKKCLVLVLFVSMVSGHDQPKNSFDILPYYSHTIDGLAYSANYKYKPESSSGFMLFYNNGPFSDSYFSVKYVTSLLLGDLDLAYVGVDLSVYRGIHLCPGVFAWGTPYGIFPIPWVMLRFDVTDHISLVWDIPPFSPHLGVTVDILKMISE